MTSSPSSAQPQTGTRAFRCSTMLSENSAGKRTSAPAERHAAIAKPDSRDSRKFLEFMPLSPTEATFAVNEKGRQARDTARLFAVGLLLLVEGPDFNQLSVPFEESRRHLPDHTNANQECEFVPVFICNKPFDACDFVA